MYRKRLYAVTHSVSSAQELEHSLVNGPAHGEPECRVESVFHVCEILMRKQFEKCCGYRWSPGLAVGAVCQLASVPVRFILASHVRNYLGLNVIGKYPAENPVLPVGIFSGAFAYQCIYRQCSDGGIAGHDAGIGMKRE